MMRIYCRDSVIVWVLFLGFFLLGGSSCALSRKAKRLNEQEGARITLYEVVEALEESEAPRHPIRTLYLSDTDSLYTDRLEQIADLLPPNTPEARLLAFLLGDGSFLIRYGLEPEEQAQGYLLNGNLYEAARLAPHHAPTIAMVSLLRGDTLQAIGLLEEVMHDKKAQRILRLNAARVLSQLNPRNTEALLSVLRLTANPWEQFVASRWLDFYAGRSLTYNPQNSRERFFVEYLEALRKSDSGDHQIVRQLLEGIPTASWQKELQLSISEMEQLRYKCLVASDFVGALYWHQQLPMEDQMKYPYLLLSEYQGEIEQMARYEAEGEQEEEPVMIMFDWEPPQDNSFRGQWGDVENRDNWALQAWSDYLGASTQSTKGLSRYEYHELQKRLQEMMRIEKKDTKRDYGEQGNK